MSMALAWRQLNVGVGGIVGTERG